MVLAWKKHCPNDIRWRGSITSLDGKHMHVLQGRDPMNASFDNTY